MTTLIVYKALLAIVLVASGASSGGITYYFNQRTTDLNNRVVSLDEQLNSSNNQVSSLSNQISTLNSQVSQLQSANSELRSQITSLRAQIATLNQTSTVKTKVLSQGSIDLSGYGATAYVPFTVESGIVFASLNVTFSVSGGYTVRAALLSQGEHATFKDCNCVFYGNYTSLTWLSPDARSYTTIVRVPYSGLWYLAFMEPPGTGSGLTITEAVTLTTRQSQREITQTLSSGSLFVTFNGISYVSFPVTKVPAELSVTFSITDFNSYYPQSIALHLLDQEQHALFQAGNYTLTTWSYPYSTTLTSSRITIPSTGVWYLAFQEQNPDGGFPATVSYNLRLTNWE